MNIETVNELIQSLESAGELSIKETKYLELAKAYQQLAAENVKLKRVPETDSVAMLLALDSFRSEPLRDVGLHKAFKSLMCHRKTPATDRIVAEAEARGVEKFAAHLRANDNGASVCKMIALGADDFAKQLRDGGNGE